MLEEEDDALDARSGPVEMGRIMGLNRERGFGFIASTDDQRQIYFHHSAVLGGRDLDDLVVGDLVEYRRINHNKGPRALDVRFVEGAVEKTGVGGRGRK